MSDAGAQAPNKTIRPQVEPAKGTSILDHPLEGGPLPVQVPLVGEIGGMQEPESNQLRTT